MCLIPRLAQALDDLADLGPDRGLQLDRAAQPVVDADQDHRVPVEMGLLQGSYDHGGHRRSLPASMNRLLPTRMVWPSIWTVMP